MTEGLVSSETDKMETAYAQVWNARRKRGVGSWWEPTGLVVVADRGGGMERGGGDVVRREPVHPKSEHAHLSKERLSECTRASRLDAHRR